jgi:hypothetical protein
MAVKRLANWDLDGLAAAAPIVEIRTPAAIVSAVILLRWLTVILPWGSVLLYAGAYLRA